MGAVKTDQLGQEFHYPGRTDGAGEIDGLAFAGVFVDDCQAFQLLFVGTALEEEVVPPQLDALARNVTMTISLATTDVPF